MPRPKTGRAKHDPISLETRINEYKAAQEKIRVKKTKQRIQEIRRLICNYFGRGIYASLNLVDIYRPADDDPIDQNYNGLRLSASPEGQALADKGGVGTVLPGILITFRKGLSPGSTPQLIVHVFKTDTGSYRWGELKELGLWFSDGLSNQERIHNFVKLLAEVL
jgi:hypothetical protein